MGTGGTETVSKSGVIKTKEGKTPEASARLVLLLDIKENVKPTNGALYPYTKSPDYYGMLLDNYLQYGGKGTISYTWDYNKVVNKRFLESWNLYQYYKNRPFAVIDYGGTDIRPVTDTYFGYWRIVLTPPNLNIGEIVGDLVTIATIATSIFGTPVIGGVIGQIIKGAEKGLALYKKAVKVYEIGGKVIEGNLSEALIQAGEILGGDAGKAMTLSGKAMKGDLESIQKLAEFADDKFNINLEKSIPKIDLPKIGLPEIDLPNELFNIKVGDVVALNLDKLGDVVEKAGKTLTAVSTTVKDSSAIISSVKELVKPSSTTNSSTTSASASKETSSASNAVSNIIANASSTFWQSGLKQWLPVLLIGGVGMVILFAKRR